MRVSARALLAVVASLWLVGGARAAAVSEPGDVAPPAIAADVRCPPEPTAPTADQAADFVRGAVDSGLLWKATKDGRAVYLYGTIHVAKLAWAFPGREVLQAVRASDVIALELDMTDPDVLGRLRKAIERRPDAPPLPEALQRRLDAQMAANCIAPDRLATMRPELQAVTVDMMTGRQFGLYSDFGIDMVVAGVATALKKPIRSLETPESQAALLVSDDPAETARTVGDVLDDLEGGKSPQMLQRLAGDWQRGDLADMEAYPTWCGCLETAQQRADFVKLVDDRNPLMADKIVKWHAEGKSLFVAVGSLHMTGPGGLPALLKARGFQVERVVFPRMP